MRGSSDCRAAWPPAGVPSRGPRLSWLLLSLGEQFTTEAATFTLLGLIVGLVVGAAGSTADSALVSHSGASSATGGAGLPSPFLSRLTDINAQAGWG